MSALNIDENQDFVEKDPNRSSTMMYDSTAAVQMTTLSNNDDATASSPLPDDVDPKAVDTPKTDGYKYPLNIAFRNLEIKLRVPIKHAPLPNIFTPLRHLVNSITSLFTNTPSSQDFYRIKNVSGLVKAGTMTLVLAPSGHGKSSYLKAISNEIKVTGGYLAYNGVPINEIGKHGADPRKMIAYQDQVDLHLSLLNVHETISFASQMGSIYGSAPARINEIIESLGLGECAATLIGDHVIRGISGGQKRRVTTAVAMASDATCLCLDEYSNGLDSAVTEKITQNLRNWCRTTDSAVVATLQQPTPTIFDMFDRVVAMKEGVVVYDGPREDILSYFVALGFECPEDIDACDFIIDVLSQPRAALYNLRLAALKEQRMMKKNKKGKMIKKAGRRVEIETSIGPLPISPTPCLTTQEMLDFFLASPFWRSIDAEINQYIKAEHPQSEDGLVDYTLKNTPIEFPLSASPLLYNDGAKKRFSTGFRLPFFETLKYALQRQAKITRRNIPLTVNRWINTFSVSLIVSALFYQVPRENPQLRVAAILLSMSQAIYVNMIELSSVNTDKKIIQREVKSSAYPSIAYVLSSFCGLLPFSLFDTFIYSMIFYFMEGFYLGFKQFIAFWFLLILTAWCSWAWFRFCAILMPDMARSLMLASPTVSYMSTFAGFYIAYDQLPRWLLWFYYFSPFSWLLRAFANNEFLSPGYSQIVTNPVTGNQTTLGIANLDAVQMFKGELWILYCTLYVVGFTIVMIITQALLLKRTPPEASMGTRRVKDHSEDEIDLNSLDEQFVRNQQAEEFRVKRQLQQLNTSIIRTQQDHASRVAQSQREGSRKSQSNRYHDENGPEPSVSHLSRSEMSQIIQSSLAKSTKNSTGSSNGEETKMAMTTLTTKLPFYPTSLSFSDLSYTVLAKDLAGHTHEKRLLNKIQGNFVPGTLSALMGASGAGKTTLLDVLAGLKNTGEVNGLMLFNGIEADKETRGILTGYVQQFASLWGFSSVEETLLYAARLRMDKDIPDDVKKKVVEEILDVLELTPIRQYIIGNFMVPGLSPAQIKKVSIGIELVANPSIIFLDEPTTGLDSKSAATVCRAMKRVANTGRTVICTIHQPSAELYYFFDCLYLLAPGGHQIYGGSVGYRSRDFIQYLESVKGVDPMVARSNPANWMLIESSKDPNPELVTYQYVKEHTTLLQDNDLDSEGWEAMSLTKRWIFYLKWHYFHTSVAWKTVADQLDIVEDIYFTENPALIRPKRYGPDRLTKQQLLELKQAPDGSVLVAPATEPPTPNSPAPMETVPESVTPPESPNNATAAAAVSSPTLFQTPEVSVNKADGQDVVNDGQKGGDKANENDAHESSGEQIEPSTNQLSPRTNPQNHSGDSDPEIVVDDSADVFAQAHARAKEGLHKPEPPPVMYQLLLVLQRHFTLYYRNPDSMINRLVLLLSTSIITGIIYLHFFKDKLIDVSSIISAMACLVMVCATFSFNIANPLVPLYIFHRPVFYREKAQGYYKYMWLWSFANSLNEFFWIAPLSFIACIPVWFLVGYPSDAAIFFKYWFGLYITMITFLSAQQFFSAFVPNLSFSQLSTSVLTGLAFNLNGIGTTLAVLKKISGFHQALYWMLPLGPLNLFLSSTLFASKPNATINVAQGGVFVPVSLKEFAKHFFGYNYDLTWFYLGVVLIQMFVWQLGYNLSTHFMNHNKR